jgi:hypothetical protein
MLYVEADSSGQLSGKAGIGAASGTARGSEQTSQRAVTRTQVLAGSFIEKNPYSLDFTRVVWKTTPNFIVCIGVVLTGHPPAKISLGWYGEQPPISLSVSGWY